MDLYSEKEIGLDEALKPIMKYEKANTIPYLPFQLLNSFENGETDEEKNINKRRREEFLYLIDRLTCDYMNDKGIELKYNKEKGETETFVLDQFVLNEKKKVCLPLIRNLFKCLVKYIDIAQTTCQTLLDNKLYDKTIKTCYELFSSAQLFSLKQYLNDSKDKYLYSFRIKKLPQTVLEAYKTQINVINQCYDAHVNFDIHLPDVAFSTFEYNDMNDYFGISFNMGDNDSTINNKLFMNICIEYFNGSVVNNNTYEIVYLSKKQFR